LGLPAVSPEVGTFQVYFLQTYVDEYNQGRSRLNFPRQTIYRLKNTHSNVTESLIAKI
jgi:hypothetical protein